jgi:hypothetical protein
MIKAQRTQATCLSLSESISCMLAEEMTNRLDVLLMINPQRSSEESTPTEKIAFFFCRLLVQCFLFFHAHTHTHTRTTTFSSSVTIV